MNDRGRTPPVRDGAATAPGAGAVAGRVLQHGPALLLAVVVALLWFSPSFASAATLTRAAILVVFTIAAWAFGFFAEPIASLVFFLLAVIFHIAAPPVVFSGFASPAWWLVFGGSIIGMAVNMTGLGERLAALVFGRVSGSYLGAVSAVATVAVALAFIMPSTAGRIILLTPIVLAFADRLGLTPGRPGRTGLVMTLAAASYMPTSSILPANVPNTVLLGAADTLYGIKLAYGPYLLLHFPVLGALKMAAIVWLVCRVYPEQGKLALASTTSGRSWSQRERWLAVLLLASLILFATDFWHGVSPAWVALGAGILCLMPGADLVPVKSFAERLNIVTLLYVAGFLGVGAVVADSGLGAVVSDGMLRIAGLTPGHTTTNLATLAVIDAGIGLLTTLSGLPAVLTPLAKHFATASGLPLEIVLMLQVPVFSTVFLPYQSPPMMIGMQLGGVTLRQGARLCLPLAAITVLLLLPLDYLWWRVLGYLP
jgi:di/tricarboxylate transporter